MGSDRRIVCARTLGSASSTPNTHLIRNHRVVPSTGGIISRLRGSSSTGTFTYVLPITSDQRKTDPDLAKFCEERKQRRSRSGHRWKNVLRFILQGMISGQCDLDILLDPYFLHFPRTTDKKMWYPGLGSKSRSIPNLATALSMLDFAEPWRNQYRPAIVNHPGSSIPRLIGKFVAK